MTYFPFQDLRILSVECRSSCPTKWTSCFHRLENDGRVVFEMIWFDMSFCKTKCSRHMCFQIVPVLFLPWRSRKEEAPKITLRLQKRRLEIALNVANRGTSTASSSILHKNTGGNAQSTSCEYSGWMNVYINIEGVIFENVEVMTLELTRWRGSDRPAAG